MLNPGGKILVDSAAFLALYSNQDPDHVSVKEEVNRLRNEQQILFTTNFIRSETYTLIGARLFYDDARDWLRNMDLPMEYVNPSDEKQAIDILRDFDDKSFSFVDATSFAVMERLGVNTALTLDSHFEQFGYRTLGLS